MNQFRLSLIVLTAILMVSCKKEEQVEPTPAPVNFVTGTWTASFNYDDGTTDIDTFLVKNNGILEMNDGNGKETAHGTWTLTGNQFHARYRIFYHSLERFATTTYTDGANEMSGTWGYYLADTLYTSGTLTFNKLSF